MAEVYEFRLNRLYFKLPASVTTKEAIKRFLQTSCGEIREHLRAIPNRRDIGAEFRMGFRSNLGKSVGGEEDVEDKIVPIHLSHHRKTIPSVRTFFGDSKNLHRDHSEVKKLSLWKSKRV